MSQDLARLHLIHKTKKKFMLELAIPKLDTNKVYRR